MGHMPNSELTLQSLSPSFTILSTKLPDFFLIQSLTTLFFAISLRNFFPFSFLINLPESPWLIGFQQHN